MRQGKPLLVRGLATGVMALGLMGATALPVMAQELCRNQPVLAAVDGNGDGFASVGEIRAVAPDNAELQAAADRLEGEGYSGIRYTGCDGSGDGGTGTGDDGGQATGDDGGQATGDGGAATGGEATGDDGAAASGDGGAATGGEATGDGAAADATTSGDSSTSSAGGAETGDDTTASVGNAVISDLPSVGQGTSAVDGWNATMVTLALGAAGIMALGAAVALRRNSLT